MAPDGSPKAEAPGLIERVGRALEAWAACVHMLLRDDAVSAEHALHVVVMNPSVQRDRVAFESAILAERSVGEPQRWEADYAFYARAKARLAWREGATTHEIVDEMPACLRRGDLLVEGAVCRHGWIVAASGAQPWYDAAFAAMLIELCHADLRQSVAQARQQGATW